MSQNEILRFALNPDLSGLVRGTRDSGSRGFGTAWIVLHYGPKARV